MSEKVKSFCRNCSALCAMELTIEDDKIANVMGDGSVSPYGAYMCTKGRSSAELHNGDGRLLHSIKRMATGQFESIGSSQALDEIAVKLAALLEEHGPRSIAIYYGTGAYRSVLGGQLQRSFLAAIKSPNQFSTMTIDQSAKWVTMGRMGTMASGKPSTADIDLAVIVGNNPVVSHQTYPFAAGTSGAPGKSFMEAKKRGLRLIVIDPRRSETARLADLFIQPLPGQDAVLFAAIAHILLRDNTFNKDFTDRFASQIDVLRTAVIPFTPQLASQRADVPVEQIELAAKWIGNANRPFVGSGTGPSMSAHSNLNDHMIEVVNALVGGYRRAGDLVRNPGTLNPRTFIETAVSPTRTWERGIKCRTADIGHLFGEFPTALLPQEILAPGPDRIRALINFGGDPLMALGDPARALPAFQDLDLLVSLDVRINETGMASDYVIAASLPFERHDVSTPGDSLYPVGFAQYAPPVLRKPEGVIDDWEFFWGIAARMGVPLTLKYWTYGREWDSIPDGLPLDMQQRPNPEDMIRFLCKNSAVDFEVLKANPAGVRAPASSQRVLAAKKDSGGRLQLCPPDIVAELLSLVHEPCVQGFSHYLVCRRILEAMNGNYRDSARTRIKYPVNWAYLNPHDMEESGITDEQEVRLESEFGSIKALAKADAGVRRGVVSMTHMFGKPGSKEPPTKQAGSYTGQLTSLQKYLEPINFMPRFSGVPINVIAL